MICAGDYLGRGGVLLENPHQFVPEVTKGWSLIRVMLSAVKDHLKSA